MVGYTEVTGGTDGGGEIFKVLGFGSSKGRGEFVPSFAVF